MGIIFTFLLVRLLFIGLVVVGVALLGAVAFAVAKRAGRLDDARRVVTPILRDGLGSRRGIWGTVGRAAARHLDR